MKKVVCIVSILLMVLGWMVVAKSIIGDNMTYNENIKLARQSVDQELYEQGVDYYYRALSIKENKGIYKEIKEAYYSFYNQQNNEYSYNRYISSLKQCCELFKNDSSFWEELISASYKRNRISDTFSYIKRARNNGVETDLIKEIESEILCIYRVDYKNAKSYVSGRNTTYSVSNENSAWVMRYNGDTIGIGYKYVGPLDERGMGIFVDNNGSTIRDSSQITRVLLFDEIEKSGYFNSGLIPVQIDGKWYYLNERGEKINIGPFDMACSMCKGSGAVFSENKWQIINTDGSKKVNFSFNGIVLDQFGCHSDGSRFIASIDGKYFIYDFDGNVISELSNVEDVSVGNYSNWFAYKDKKSGRWGFMDYSGSVVIDPSYKCAKGFSNGYAAVSNENGLWGFVNAEGKQVINYEFYYVGYFTPEENCVVSRTEGALGILYFAYR